MAIDFEWNVCVDISFLVDGMNFQKHCLLVMLWC